jgi:hypothetical protein
LKSPYLMTVGACVVTALLLSGCSAKAAATVTSGPAEQPTGASTAAATPSVAAAPAAGANSSAALGDVTPPGTVLALGDTALVDYPIMTYPNGLDKDPVASDPGALLMKLTITSLAPASVDDLPSGTIITGTTEDKLSVVKVNYEAQATGTPAISMERRGLISDFDPEGYNSFMFFDSQGEIPGCVNPSNLGTAFDGGEAVQGCFLVAYLTASGVPSITFKPYGGDLYTNPLVWNSK